MLRIIAVYGELLKRSESTIPHYEVIIATEDATPEEPHPVLLYYGDDRERAEDVIHIAEKVAVFMGEEVSFDFRGGFTLEEESE